MLYDKITHRSETNGHLDPCQAIPTPVISKITHPLLSMDHFFPGCALLSAYTLRPLVSAPKLI